MKKNIVYAISVVAGIFISQKIYYPFPDLGKNIYSIVLRILKGVSLEILVSQFWVKKISSAVILPNMFSHDWIIYKIYLKGPS